MFELVALVDDDEPLVLRDYGLDLVGLMTGNDGKAIPLPTNAFVFIEGHQHATVASVRPAFALELELVVRAGPVARALIEGGDPLVHRTHHVFVPSLTLEPFFHRSILLRRHPPAALTGFSLWHVFDHQRGRLIRVVVAHPDHTKRPVPQRDHDTRSTLGV
jgi:hypothetical protein